MEETNIQLDPNRSQVQRSLILFVVLIAILLSLSATVGSFRSIGMPFPSLFIDPYGVFSAVYLPAWKMEKQDIRHTDKLVSIENQPIGLTAKYGDFPQTRLNRKLALLHSQGKKKVNLIFSRFGERVNSETFVRKIGKDEICAFFLLYQLIGWLLLWSGILVIRYAYFQPAARAYSFTAFSSFLFFATFFDYHTTAWLVPFFALGTIGQTIGPLWLAYTFPQIIARQRKLLQAIMKTTSLTAAVAAFLLVIGPIIEFDTRWIRTRIDFLFPTSLVILGVSVLIRLLTGSGQTKRQMKSVALGLLWIPVFVGIAYPLHVFYGGPVFHVFLPLGPFFITVSIGYSFIRYNILNAGVVIDRRMFWFPVLLIGLCLGVITFQMVDVLVPSDYTALVLAVGAGLIVCTIAVSAGKRIITETFFPAVKQFKPTVEQLAEKLTVLTEYNEIKSELIALVKQWLPAIEVNVIELQELHLNQEQETRLAENKHIWFTSQEGNKYLLQPMNSAGTQQGILQISQKRFNALYTEADLGLLKTIASLGAIALHNVDMLQKVNRRRRHDVQATEKDKQISISVLGAEIAHEIIYPLNFFKFLLKQLKIEGKVESDDVEIGQEEVERLNRMLFALRKLQHPSPAKTEVLVLPILNRAVNLLRDAIESRKIILDIQITEHLSITSDSDPLLQLFANLLRNAIQAVDWQGLIEVVFKHGPEKATIEFLDSGPGVPKNFKKDIFSPWTTTKNEGAGLGLTVCQRIARSFGWTISMHRKDNKTCFAIELPSSDVVNQ